MMRDCKYCGTEFQVPEANYHRTTCSEKCSHDLRTISRNGTKVEQFWSKVHKTDSCWEWTGTIIHNGYGHFSIKSRYKMAHRFSYELHYGPIPTGLCVLHRCDNRRCVRPDHLFLGTKKDNAQDAIAKNRFTNGERHWMRRHPERAKLTDAQVAEITERYKRGGVLQRELAAEYGVTRPCISAIVNRKIRLLGR